MNKKKMTWTERVIAKVVEPDDNKSNSSFHQKRARMHHLIFARQLSVSIQVVQIMVEKAAGNGILRLVYTTALCY